MLKVGLTGGIGCGKTRVSNLFQSLNVPVIDADCVARDLLKPDQLALRKVVEHFGEMILLTDGSLDRAQLRQRIFNNPSERKQLDAIMHPLIFTEIKSRIDQLNSSYIIVVIPLLFETFAQRKVDRVLLIDCPVDIQIARVSARDHVDHRHVEAIIASQCPREQRLALTHDVIFNGAAEGSLAEAVKRLHNFYTKLATVRIPSA